MRFFISDQYIDLILSPSKDEYAPLPETHPFFRFTKAVIRRLGSSLR
jgi:hypothetical protein